MNAEQWTVDGFHPLLLALLVIWLIWHAYVAAQDTRALIRHMWRYRQFPVPGRTPKGRVVRHSSQTVRGPAMASDDVTRITGSHWPPATQGFPNPGNLPGPGNPRRGRAGLVAAAVVLLVAGVAAGAYVLGSRSSATGASSPRAAAVTSAAPVKLDSYARLACQKLDKAVGEAEGDKFAKLNASLDEYSARVTAAGSSVAELAAIAKQDDDPALIDAVTAQLREWCTAHWSPGR